MKLKLLSVFCFVFFGGLFLFFSDAQAGFGASPSKIVNEHLSPGSHFEQIIYLVQSKPENDLKTTIAIDKDSPVKDWISIDRGTEFTIPAGIQQFPIKVSVDVPSSAEFKKYGGFMDIEGKNEKESGGNVTMSVGVRIGFSLEVTKEAFTDFVLRGVKVPDVEEGWSVKIFITIENLGNTKAGPSKISLEILDQKKNKIKDLGEVEISDGAKINPFGTGDIIAEFSNDLAQGEYWAKTKIFNGEKVLTENTQLFSVMPKGSLKKSSLAGFGGILGLPGWATYALIAAIGCGLFMLKKREIISGAKFRNLRVKIRQRQRRRLEKKLRRLK